MSDNDKEKLTLDDFKNKVLEMELENLSKVTPEKRDKMVARIMAYYEKLEGRENDNK